MIFNELLKALAGRIQARGAVMIDKDGEIVASWTAAGLDMALVGAHYEIVLDAANEVSLRHGGPAGSIFIKTVSWTIAILAIKEGYCLVLVMDRAALFGKVLLEAERTVREIETEMG